MNKIRKNLGKQETNLSPISTPAITQGYIEGGPQDRKISARAVFFGGEHRFSCCRNNRFPFSTIGRE